MISIYPYEELGHASNSWLDVRHHFSFANYYDSTRIEFGKLQVLNEDLIKPDSGFQPHPHKDVELITIVREGTITHQDSEGNSSELPAGSVQIISAGKGIIHSEKNLNDCDASILQIWIEPREMGLIPNWACCEAPDLHVTDSLKLIVSGDGAAPLAINQDAYLYLGKLEQGTSIEHSIHNQAYVLILDGDMEINGDLVNRGDGAEISGEASIEISARTDSEIMVIDVPR